MGKILIEELPKGALGSGKLYFTDDTPTVRTKITQADKIRAMSDEELAEFLSDCFKCKMCGFGADGICYSVSRDCVKGIVKWLKSEVKE